MQWLITGGCGFLGTNLIANLVAEGGHSIRVLDNLSVGSREDLRAVTRFKEIEAVSIESMSSGSHVELVVGDIMNEPLALKVAHGADVIVHLAANTGVAPSVEDPRSDCLTNVIGTLNYLEASRHSKVPRFVFASSGAPVGECKPPIHEEMPSNPVSPYGASKLAGEGYCSSYFRTFNIDTVALRFGNVYGPGSSHKSSVVAKFIRRALEGKELVIYGDGTQTRDFIYVDDLIHAIRQAVVCSNVGGEKFQIATHQETTVNEMADLLVAAIRKKGIEVPAVQYAEKRLGDVMRNYSDISKAARMLQWNPEVTLQHGIQRTVDWMLAVNN